MSMYIFEGACPLCGGDVKGNEEYRYFCKSCNVLFKREYLVTKKRKEVSHSEEHLIEEELKHISEEIKHAEEIAFSEDTGLLEEPEEELQEKEIVKKEEIKIVASAKSDKMHISTCHFLKKIHKDNWIYLDSLEDGLKKEYTPCVCIRRTGLMKI